VPDLLGAGVEEHVSVAVGAAEAPALEEVLEADADLALDSADRLLQIPGEDRVWFVHPHFVGQLFGVSEHGFLS
jgi:hypothetical protein